MAWCGVPQPRRRPALHRHISTTYTLMHEKEHPLYVSTYIKEEKYTNLLLHNYCSVQPVLEQMNLDMKTPGGLPWPHTISHTCKTCDPPYLESHPKVYSLPARLLTVLSWHSVLIPSPLEGLPSFPHSLLARWSLVGHGRGSSASSEPSRDPWHPCPPLLGEGCERLRVIISTPLMMPLQFTDRRGAEGSLATKPKA